jgi:hypothetical protein
MDETYRRDKTPAEQAIDQFRIFKKMKMNAFKRNE